MTFVEGCSWAKLSDGSWGVRVNHYSGGRAPHLSGRTAIVVTRKGRRSEVRLGAPVDRRSYCTIYRAVR